MPVFFLFSGGPAKLFEMPAEVHRFVQDSEDLNPVGRAAVEYDVSAFMITIRRA